MKSNSKAFLLIIIVAFTILSLNFISAGTCEGNYDKVTACSVVDCGSYQVINNACVDGNGNAAPSYCKDIQMGLSRLCKNEYSICTLSGNQCSSGCEATTTSTSCSVFTTPSSCLYGCNWAEDENIISCSKSNGVTTLSNTILTNNNQVRTDTCSSNTKYVYTCANDEQSIIQGETTCPLGCESSGLICKTIYSYSCIDTDSKSTTVATQTSLTTTFSDNSQSTVSSTDICHSTTQVREYFCATGTSNSISNELISCTGDYTCSGGKCIPPADITNPVVAISYPTATTYNSQIQELQFTASDTNLDSCKYSRDGTFWFSTEAVTSGTNTVRLDSVEGANTWSIKCVDKSANSQNKSVSFTVTLPEAEEEDETIITCSDIDPSTSIITKIGDTVTNTNTLKDFCTDAKLTSYSCNVNSRESKTETCPNGCSDRKCNDPKAPIATFCSTFTTGTRLTTTWTNNEPDTFDTQDNICKNDGITLTKYSCNGKVSEQQDIICPGGCEDAKCQDSTSYWANAQTKVSSSSAPVVTSSSPQEIKLIIKNVGDKTSEDFKIFEKETNTLIDTVTAEKVDNTLVANYIFTSSILDKVNSESSEFTFYFTANTISTENPEINLLIQKEELMCPTDGTEEYNNNICDKEETGLLCPLDCFVVGDGVCNEKLREDILSSFYDCGAGVNDKLAWTSINDLRKEITDVLTIDSNKIHEESFVMVAFDEDKKSESTFELIVIKNLKEFPLGKFEGIRDLDTVFFEWTPSYKDFEQAKEVPSQTEFKFFFKINGIRSKVLKIELSESTLPTCFDKEKNGNEEEVDCGGSCSLSCSEASFCREKQIISCSAYTESGESYCEENPCSLYGDSNSNCYWDTDKCEKKTVGSSGVCYYKEEVESEDNCDDGYLLYNYDSLFEWKSDANDTERKESNEEENCVPVSEPVSCSLPGESLEPKQEEVISDTDAKKYDTKEIAKIGFLGVLGILIIYFTLKILKSNKEDGVAKAIKDNFVKSEEEEDNPKEKKILGEVKIKTKKERELEKLMEDFEMDL